jgi:CheY-like chemotaxis protein
VVVITEWPHDGGGDDTPCWLLSGVRIVRLWWWGAMPMPMMAPRIHADLSEYASLLEPAAATEGAPGRHGDWRTSSPTVLIVDDDEDIRDVLTLMLEREGLRTVRAASAQGALDVIGQQDLAAVLLDVMLPDRSGLEVCRAVRDGQHGRGLPILMLTALDSVADEVSGILAGADGYLVKPILPSELLLRLRDVI